MNFIFKIVGAPKTALGRQIGEAIRIRNRGGRGKFSMPKENITDAKLPD